MKTDNIKINDNRRCSAERLETLISNLPVRLESFDKEELKLTASMGLGKIIYIRPLEGIISRIQLPHYNTRVIGKHRIVVESCCSNSVLLNYLKQKYEIFYGR